MIVETSRLIMRPFNYYDSKEFFEITRDSLIQKYVPYAYPENLEQAVEDVIYYSRSDFENDFYFVLESKESHKMIGVLIVSKNYKGYFDMSLVIGKEYRRKGYITEAIKGFSESLPKGSTLLFVINQYNVASLSTVQKLPNIEEITNSEHSKKLKLATSKIFKFVV